MIDLTGKSVFVKTQEEYLSVLKIARFQGFKWARENHLNHIEIPFPNILIFYDNKTVTYSFEKTLLEASKIVEDEKKIKDAVKLVRTFAKYPDRTALTDSFIKSLKLLADTVETQIEEVKQMERLTEKQRHILQQKLCDMKRRCYNPEEKFYKDYGGRGIKICDEWMDKKEGHSNFQKWAVENGWEEGRSIDRIDVNGNYEPSNCRWATPEEQANNRRNNNYITINGVTKTTSEWARQIGISQNAFTGRINSGWTGEELLKPKFKPLKMSKAKMAKEIRAWRNAEEQGLLVRLPCKVGDILFRINKGARNPIIKMKVSQITMISKLYNIKAIQEDYGEVFFSDDVIGIKVFTTSEEAEKKLEELGNDKT